MTEDEMLSRISSKELTRWVALYSVEADELEYERHKRESKDGQVFIQGQDSDDEDDDDGTPE